MRKQIAVGVNIIYDQKENLYYQSIDQYYFYGKMSATDFNISFTLIEEKLALQIIDRLKLVKLVRRENHIHYDCKEKIKLDKIKKAL